MTLALASLCAWSASGFIDPVSDLRVPPKNFDLQGTLSADGRHVIVTGSIGNCEPSEKTAETQVSIVQTSTLASANDSVTQPCPSGSTVDFLVEATVPEGKPPFAEGPAQACGFAISRSGVRPSAAASAIA